MEYFKHGNGYECGNGNGNSNSISNILSLFLNSILYNYLSQFLYFGVIWVNNHDFSLYITSSSMENWRKKIILQDTTTSLNICQLSEKYFSRFEAALIKCALLHTSFLHLPRWVKKHHKNWTHCCNVFLDSTHAIKKNYASYKVLYAPTHRLTSGELMTVSLLLITTCLFLKKRL